MKKELEERFFHWVWGENNIRSDRPEYLINLEIGVVIRFYSELAMFTDFDEFYENIADVQFWKGDRPDDEQELEKILIDAWNFLALEERILENDLNEDELSDDLFN